MTITFKERRWDWRTWNLLLQIRRATDGEDPRQESGEMDSRGIASAETSPLRALMRRKWIRAIDAGEVFDDDGGSRFLTVWEITAAGRAALDAARKDGITIQ